MNHFQTYDKFATKSELTVALEKDGARSPTLTKQFYSLINVDQKATIVIPGICICVPVDPGGPVDP